MAQFDVQTVLPFIEKGGGICFLDTEATGLKADYNSLLVASVKPIGKKPVSFVVKQLGHDQKLVKDLKTELSKYLIWVSYFGFGFDIPMINTRLLHAGQEPLPKRHQIDLYYALKYKLLMARRSQAHILEWLGTPQKKMTVSPSVWNLAEQEKDLPTLIKRCESDVEGLEAMYQQTKHLIVDLKMR
jgi:uncharacterized protein YprB with RNaseH-like and TPR domain